MSAKKILVADAETPILHLLSKYFDSAGYEARLAANSDDALKILAQESISVMFFDLGLEPINGFDLCKQIRKDRTDAIIYALTRFSKLFGPQEIHEAGFNGYFAKPLFIEKIILFIEKIIQAASGAFEQIDQLAEKSRRRPIEKILIVDDDKQMRKMLRQMLEHEGYTVAEASDGQKGFECQTAQPADLIIMDIVMPGKSGVETMLEIKKTGPGVNFIVMTGGGWYSAEVDLDVARTLGAKAIKKPFTREQILSIIKRMHN